MSQDQFLSWVRTTIAGISGWAIGKGYGDASLWTMISGMAVLIVPYVWGALAHTDSAKLAAVEALPDVRKVVVTASATDGVQEAAADPSRPKVVTQ